MGKMTRGKILEATATLSAFRPCGTGEGAYFMEAFCNSFGVPFRRTNEEDANRRKSVVFMNDQRLNNGRGEIFWDCIVQVAIVKSGDLLAEIPVSLKGGDSRDLSTDIPWMKSAVEAGMPLWVYLLDGDADEVEYEDGARMDVPPARNLTMRRINVTPLLRDTITDWNKVGDSKAAPAFIRENKVGKYTYPRVRVNWNKVPSAYWLDAGYIPFDPAAPIPSPF